MTIKSCILEYLQTNGASWGRDIDDYIRDIMGTKTSNTSRRCRELVSEGKLDVCYKVPPNGGPKASRYRIKTNL